MFFGVGKCFSHSTRRLAILLLAGFMCAYNAHATETRSFAINMFVLATVATEANCPNGLNPLSDVFYARELRRLGYSHGEVEKLMVDFPSGPYVPLVTMRGRINGEPANIYANPESQPDPEIMPVTGRDGYGFNLNGKIEPKEFIDPETQEHGVDNGLWRALGCTQNFHVSLPNIANRSYSMWDGPGHVRRMAGPSYRRRLDQRP